MTRTYKKKTARWRFMQKVYYHSAGCWDWLGYKKEDQGQFMFEGKVWQARRWAWSFIASKPLPSSKNIVMTCNHISCVNPDHMKLVDKGTQGHYDYKTCIKELPKA